MPPSECLPGPLTGLLWGPLPQRPGVVRAAGHVCPLFDPLWEALTARGGAKT